MERYIELEAPLRLLTLRSPLLAESAAPAARLWLSDTADIYFFFFFFFMNWPFDPRFPCGDPFGPCLGI